MAEASARVQASIEGFEAVFSTCSGARSSTDCCRRWAASRLIDGPIFGSDWGGAPCAFVRKPSFVPLQKRARHSAHAVAPASKQAEAEGLATCREPPSLPSSI